MKRVTLLICFLVSTFGFAQTVVEDFDPIRTIVSGTNPFFQDNTAGTVAMEQVSDPESGAPRGNVLRLITSASEPWQGAGLILQSGFELDLTNDPVDPDEKKVNVWVYSNTATDILAKVTNGVGAVAASATDASHTGTGWEQLIFDFANRKDNVGPPSGANGVYPRITFFPAWRVIGACTVGCFPDRPAIPNQTIYIDEISYGTIVPPSTDTNWTGGSSTTNWNTPGNWSNGVPVASSNVIIPDTAFDPIAAGAVELATLLIEANAAVTINGAVTNSGTITVSSGASFIAKTSVSGTVTYERDLNSTNWHYISSPVIGQDVDDFVAASGLQSGGSDISFCTFDTTANDWNFYQNGTSNANVLNTGQGYIVNLTAASGTLSFTGTMNVSDVSKALSTTGEGYNLLGNPYPSFINSGTLLSNNSGALFSQTVWVWDQSNDDYTTYVTVDDFEIAPGQGFFVQSNGAAGSVSITEALQSHQTDTFLRSSGRSEIFLTLADGTNTKDCKLYYINGTTTSFDNGYDGLKFRAFSEPLSIYTHLITNGFGRDYSIQSLPDNDYENLIVPIGVDAAAGTSITISADAANLPSGTNIYLEDRLLNTFTLLDASSNFTLTPSTSLNGTGRFYLRTTNAVLSVDENSRAYDLQIYTSNSTQQLIIEGEIVNNTAISMYDLQGKLVLNQVLETINNVNTLDISALGSGLYIVKVNNGQQTMTQKVIIQ